MPTYTQVNTFICTYISKQGCSASVRYCFTVVSRGQTPHTSNERQSQVSLRSGWGLEGWRAELAGSSRTTDNPTGLKSLSDWHKAPVMAPSPSPLPVHFKQTPKTKKCFGISHAGSAIFLTDLESIHGEQSEPVFFKQAVIPADVCSFVDAFHPNNWALHLFIESPLESNHLVFKRILNTNIQQIHNIMQNDTNALTYTQSKLSRA